jgi:hypothetical protein
LQESIVEGCTKDREGGAKITKVAGSRRVQSSFAARETRYCNPSNRCHRASLQERAEHVKGCAKIA